MGFDLINSLEFLTLVERRGVFLKIADDQGLVGRMEYGFLPETFLESVLLVAKSLSPQQGQRVLGGALTCLREPRGGLVNFGHGSSR